MSAQPLGDAVSTEPAKSPSSQSLQGEMSTLVRLDPKHADDLYTLLKGEDNAALFTYMLDGPFSSLEAFQASIDTKAKSQDPFLYTVIENDTGRAVGQLSLLHIQPQHRVVEIGSVLFTHALQRTRAGTEAMYLLARHVFEDLGYRRYEWKCNTLNAQSVRTAERLGFTYEGTFRQHMITKGRSRDTAWFSIIDSEWKDIKRGFERWLSDDNFDLDGKQIATLQECRRRAT